MIATHYLPYTLNTSVISLLEGLLFLALSSMSSCPLIATLYNLHTLAAVVLRREFSQAKSETLGWPKIEKRGKTMAFFPFQIGAWHECLRTTGLELLILVVHSNIVLMQVTTSYRVDL